ncbi:MAG: DUF1801 domain-containing protein [Frankiales bacterium]|nr:DUF1801 domain-containing protein [Frankiales bacterium]
MGTVDDYLAGLDEPARAAFARVVEIACAVAPQAEQGTSYGMPALLVDGRPLLGVKAASGHLSVYPFSPAVIEAVADRLAGFALSKGTLRFSAERRLPDDVVRDVVRLRLAEILR